jgi:rhomboid family GlyGly-CTERM serine protease
LALYEAGRAQGARGRTLHIMQSSPAMSASPTFARFGAAERFALCAAVLCLLLQAWPGAPATLEYRVGVLLDEPWRALFGHFVHVNWRHALLNAVAWVLLARLFDRELGVARQCVTAVLAAIGISVMLALLQPGIAWFRGASGVLHALFFAGCATWLRRAVRAPSESRLRETLLPLALFAGGWIKLALEQPLEAELPFSQWLGAPTVPQAHLFGAMWGTVLGALWNRQR